MQRLHLEVLLVKVLVEHKEIEAPLQLEGVPSSTLERPILLLAVLLRPMDREEGALKAVRSFQGKLDSTDVDVMLQRLARCFEVEEAEGPGRVERAACSEGECCWSNRQGYRY